MFTLPFPSLLPSSPPRAQGAIDETESETQRQARSEQGAATATTPRKYTWTRLSLKTAFSGRKGNKKDPEAAGCASSGASSGRPGLALSSVSVEDFSSASDAGPAAAETESGDHSPRKSRLPMFAVPKPRREQVDIYVDAILNDPRMNIQGIPDKIERKIYTLAISMALQQCLKLLFTVNGKAILGHHVEIEMRPGRMPPLPPNPEFEQGAVMRLVEELLKEKMINLSWLHDSIEGPLYANVILAILTVMHSFFAATRFDMLGHSVGCNLSPLNQQQQENLLLCIRNRLREPRVVDEAIIEEQLDKHFLNAPPNWLPDALERPIYKTLYALVLCVTEEVFKDLRIGFLGDTCMLHLVPGPMPASPEREVLLKKAEQWGQRGHFGLGGGRHGHELLLAALCGAVVSRFLFY